MKDRNKNRPGYKKTKVGWIPRDWENVRLADVAQVDRGKFSARPRNDPRYYGGQYPFLQTGDVSGSDGTVRSYTQTLNQDGLAVSRLFPSGTLLITIAANIGDVAEVPFEFACPDSVVAIQSKEGTSQAWLKSLLATKKNYFESKATQNAQANINLETIRPVAIPLPSLPEQEAIAEVLECWDKAIRGYERKIEKKRKIKKGLMQRLLSGQQRLPGFVTTENTEGHGKKPDGVPVGWKEVRLGDMGEFSKGNGISKDQLSESGLPCIRYGEIYTSDDYVIRSFKSFIPSHLRLQSSAIHFNDLLFAGSGETIEEIGKSIAYMGNAEAFTGGDVIILSIHNTLARADYLSFFLNTAGRRALNRLGQGQSVVHIYSRDLKDVIIPTPSFPEQNAIANVLSVADAEIAALERKLAVLRDQKRFLLNNLVTGSLRLPEFCNHGRTRNDTERTR